MNEHDELRDLLALAWSEHEAPEPTPELEQSDAATRASVAWLAAAWREHAAPEAEPSAAIRRTQRRRRTAGRRGAILRPRAWQRHAAAAVLLLGLGALMHFGDARLRDHALTPVDPRPAPELVPSTPLAEAELPAPQVVAVGPDRIETRSGPVRLVLLTNTDIPSPIDAPPAGGDLR